MVRGRWLGRGQVATGSCSERLFSTRDALGPTSKEKSVCQVFSLKAATDYTSCPTDKHPAAVRTLRAGLLLPRNLETWPGMTTCASLLTTKGLSQQH